MFSVIVGEFGRVGMARPTSILRFITMRFKLPKLPGLTERDIALKANRGRPIGDLTGALNLSAR